MKGKNAGITLVELIVIIALIGVIGGWTTYNASAIFGYSAKECYRELGAAITSTKIDALSRSKIPGDTYIEISQDAKGYVYVQRCVAGNLGEKEQISPRRVTLEYREGAAGTKTSLKGSSYKIYFDRSTGAMIKYVTDPADPTKQIKQTSAIKYFYVYNGKLRNYTIECWPETGKISNL